jgi:hypothetical protein
MLSQALQHDMAATITAWTSRLRLLPCLQDNLQQQQQQQRQLLPHPQLLHCRTLVMKL